MSLQDENQSEYEGMLFYVKKRKEDVEKAAAVRTFKGRACGAFVGNPANGGGLISANPK